jgi:hypothetical protein
MELRSSESSAFFEASLQEMQWFSAVTLYAVCQRGNRIGCGEENKAETTISQRYEISGFSPLE